MTQNNKPKGANHRPKTKDPNVGGYATVYFWLARKAKEENISADQLIVYCWAYYKNRLAQFHNRGLVYGKKTYAAYWGEINDELGLSCADDCCRALERAGWFMKGKGEDYKEVPQRGYYCMLDKEQRAAALANQQQQLDLNEEIEVEVPSSQPNNGEYKFWGDRYYRDADGQPHRIPPTAPLRPTPTAVWSNEYSQWFEPGEEPEHEMEF